MNTGVKICRLSSHNEINEILHLQKKNLETNLKEEQAGADGFVTVVHSFETLSRMNKIEPSIIAKNDDKVVAYSLVMPPEFRKEIPVLEPLFKKLTSTIYKEKLLSDYNYFVMGQICVDKYFRGKGIFDKLYTKLYEDLSGKFEMLITEVASRNKRSVNAHKRVGLETILSYIDETDTWELMIWDWKNKTRNVSYK